jgi:hypothetical protein
MLNKLKPVFVFSFCLLFAGVTAQIKQFEADYKPLVSTGKLPLIYTTSATEKANTDIATAQKEKNYYTRKAKEKFYLISNFQIDQILRSGKIMFNDSLSHFVNKVADETFKGHPEIRKNIQIYILKSDIVNAFTADNGTIIVSVGLLSQLDNEAQLAYILCHETSHYLKKHSVESYVTMHSRNSYRKTNLDEYRFSQDAEFEADAEGLKLFKETSYSYKGISGAFNMLKYSYLPFDEIKFDKNFLEDSNLVFPPAYFLKELSPIKVDENYDDSKSSHPNIKKRKDNVSRELGEFSDDGREKFLVNKDDFYKMREMARFELCNIDLQQEEYADCIYESYVLLKKYPNNVYLKKMIGKALFNVAAAKAPQEKEYKDCIEPTLDIAGNANITYDYSSVEGNSQQTYHLLDKLSATESNITALHYNWLLKKELKDDKQVGMLCDSLFVMLALNNEVASGYFHKRTRREYINEMTPSPNAATDSAVVKQDTVKKKLSSLDELDNDETDSKITRINIQNKAVEIKEEKVTETDSSRADRLNTKLNDEFDKFAFAELLKEKEFSDKLAAAEEFNKAYRNRKFDNILKYKTKKKENTGGVGIDKIVILDPFYIKTDERIRESYKYYDSEERLQEYGGILKENADRVGLKNEYIDSHSLNTDDIEKYNDYTLLNDWMSEFLEHGYNRNMLILSNDAAGQMKAKYNTRYVMWGGIYTHRTEKKNIGTAVIATIFTLGLAAPFTLPYLFRKEQQTMYFAVVYDLEENEILYTNTTIVRLKDSRDFLNAFVYDTMLTLKSQPKYK